MKAYWVGDDVPRITQHKRGVTAFFKKLALSKPRFIGRLFPFPVEVSDQVYSLTSFFPNILPEILFILLFFIFKLVVGSVYLKNFPYTKHINMYATEERLLDVTA
jgi:hypothetical protein